MARSSTFRLLLAIGALIFTAAIFLTSNPELLPANLFTSTDQSLSPLSPTQESLATQRQTDVSATATHTPVPTPDGESAPVFSSEPIVGNDQNQSDTREAAEENEVNKDNSDTHGQLIIPKIKLDQDTVDLPLVDGYWPVDDLGSNVGLLGGTGEHPNDDMSMVFAGHVTTYWPINGPFAAVDELVPNDEIIYIYEEKEYVYKISRLLFAEPDQVNILLSDRGDQIILVTCGQYDYYEGSYDGRLVVLADLIEVNPILYSES